MTAGGLVMNKRPIGDSGIEVAPLALGGNVFGWTAEEASRCSTRSSMRAGR
jgi:aryl-alcohol dehydrogenase-like predicted oxidoreductase